MAESVTGGSSNQGQPPKEMSMEIRLLLAFILMGAVMFLTPYFYKSSTPPAPKTAASGQAARPAAVAPSAPVHEASVPEDAAATAEIPGATHQQAQPPFIVDTDFYRIVFSNQGATVRSWVLKKYTGNDGKPLDLVNPAAGLEYPFSLYFPDAQPTSKVNWAQFQQTPDPDGLGVLFEFSDGHTAVRKTFRFRKNSYLSEITSDVKIDGKPVPGMLQWRGGFGDLTVANPAGQEKTGYFDVAANKLVEQTPKNAKNGPATAAGNYSFAGLGDAYFCAVFLPGDNSTAKLTTFDDTVPTPADPKPVQLIGAAVSDGDPNRFQVFVGPKDVNLLKSVNPKLEQVVDFGWISILAKPLFLVVSWFNTGFVHNFGWSIVLVTIALNFILFPLRLSNMKSMRKMQALKPQIDEIGKKYKNVSLRDPRKAEQNQEVMELYKRNGVNPMGGCLPMLIQIPFLFAFYRVFTVSVEMRGASWLWVTDLSQPEHLPIKILPIIMIASQFWMQKMTPQANVDPNQQRMMMFMPLIFGFMFYQFPSGLVLYYLTSNLVNIGQQWFFNHTETAQEAARSVEPPRKKNGRK